MVKNLPAMWETQCQPLGREDPLEKGMPPTAGFLPGESHGQGLQSIMLQRVKHNWAPSTFTSILPLPTFLSPLVTSSLFSIFVSLLFSFIHWFIVFLDPQISDIIQYLSFCVRLTSLSIMPSKPNHVVANGIISFFHMAE